MEINNNTKLLVAGSIGNILEWFNFAIYGYFASIIGKLFFPADNPATSLIAAFGVFASAFLMRPIGAVIFGHLGDKYGRKLALTLSVLLMAFPTTLIGFLPTYNQIGIIAPILLIILSLLQGISVGGEFTGSISFLIENAPSHRRGYWGSWTSCTGNMGILLGSGIGALITSLFSTSTLMSFGWRIPFILGILIAFVGIYLRKEMEEPENFKLLSEMDEVSSSPVRDVLKSYWKEMITAIFATWVSATSFYMIFIYLSTYMFTETQIPLSQGLEINTICMAILIILTPIMGHVSDKMGRKKLLIGGAIGIIILSFPLFMIILQNSLILDLVAQIIFAVLIAMINGTIPTMLAELFPTKVRMAGISISYNIAMAIFGGSIPFIVTLFIKETGNKMVPVFYLILSAVVSLITYIIIQETHKEPLKN